ncbi:MAG: uroporphyrinogen-III C-methyltransferase [Hyphomicrobiales bacterium]|nr:uroporphyrinogen-III C-methyltransferase [Hyphomicrobiales bacterium]
MDFLPIFLDVRGKKIVVDGGTPVAARRVERALAADAIVHICDSNLCDEFEPLLTHKNLVHHKRPFGKKDAEDTVVLYGASEDEGRDHALFLAARQEEILVNIADVNEYCDFITPSVVERKPLVIAISSGGTAPVIARILRARIESLLPPGYGRLAEYLGQFRGRVMAQIAKTRARRRFWEEMIDGPVGDLFLSGDHTASAACFEKALDSAGDGTETALRGEVYLVGAGPGDPDLLTFRALRLMQRADVVLYDRLVGPDILELIRRDAERIYVGKLPKQHTMEQEDISALMVTLAKQGKRVLRLKGGDPFIFGRGGEEIEMIAENGIPFQVVPGITAASGCSTYSGIPLTHRDHAQACVFVTAHGKDGVLGLDWDVLLRPSQTVVVYMGLLSLPLIAEEFKKRGVSPKTPVAVVDKGTTPDQSIIISSVGKVAADVKESGVSGPAMIIIGEVVALHEKLKWFYDQPERAHKLGLNAKDVL